MALVQSGFRRIIIVDNNGGNVGPVTGAALDARRDLGVLIGHLYPWQLGYALMRDVYDDPATAYGHGAEPEHSAMLAMFPEQVQPARAGRRWSPAAAGPRRATPRRRSPARTYAGPSSGTSPR